MLRTPVLAAALLVLVAGCTGSGTSSPAGDDGGSESSTPTPAVTDVPGAATTAPAPSEERGPRLQRGIRTVAIFSAELLLIVLAIYVLGEVVGALWVVLLPVVIGLLITTVLWPPTRFLRRHGWPPALAADVTRMR